MRERGDDEGAAAMWEELGDFEDAPDKLQECNNYINYDKAVDALANKKFYEAYALFKDMGDFKDAEAKAKECIQPTPENGLMEQSEGFARNATITVKSNSAETKLIVIKIYEAYTEKVITTFFLKPGESASAPFPASLQYSAKIAAGPNWFGTADLFGHYDARLGVSSQLLV